ncbi:MULTISPECIES: hypothetical protein [Butyricimonas]|uniref:hypothetical protein n=1 Tax=Butyricimonas TaxID=574697 RepID=UPI0007FB478C|nr:MULTISPECIES: hypothetical protein [Butyricimonas]
MMKRNVGILWGIFLSIFIAACTDVYKEDDSDLSQDEEVIPPGETYTPERAHTLNVVYYVPNDVEDNPDWHYRLSGVTLHIQKFFHECFMRYRVDRKFGLELNDVNPAFVRIHYIKSARNVFDMKVANIADMAKEVLAYFEKNATEKKSDHYLVWMPEYTGSFIQHYYPSEHEGMAFCGCVNDRFRIKYFESARARATFLSKLGYVLKAFAQACFLPESNAGSESAFLSLMGAFERTGATSTSTNYSPNYNCRMYAGIPGKSGARPTLGTPDKIRLMLWDVRYLMGTQLFNDHYSYEPFDVDIEGVDIRSKVYRSSVEADTGRVVGPYYTTDTIRVSCTFRTDAELDGVVLLDDPWQSMGKSVGQLDTLNDRKATFESGFDAYGVYASSSTFEQLGENTYRVEFEFPLGNHFNISRWDWTTNGTGTGYVQNFGYCLHELRFRFVGKNGMAYPHAPVSIKGPAESLDGKVKPGLRNRYRVYRDKVGWKFYYYVDIAERYGYWEGEDEAVVEEEE